MQVGLLALISPHEESKLSWYENLIDGLEAHASVPFRVSSHHVPRKWSDLSLRAFDLESNLGWIKQSCPVSKQGKGSIQLEVLFAEMCFSKRRASL